MVKLFKYRDFSGQQLYTKKGYYIEYHLSVIMEILFVPEVYLCIRMINYIYMYKYESSYLKIFNRKQSYRKQNLEK